MTKRSLFAIAAVMMLAGCYGTQDADQAETESVDKNGEELVLPPIDLCAYKNLTMRTEVVNGVLKQVYVRNYGRCATPPTRVSMKVIPTPMQNLPLVYYNIPSVPGKDVFTQAPGEVAVFPTDYPDLTDNALHFFTADYDNVVAEADETDNNTSYFNP